MFTETDKKIIIDLYLNQQKSIVDISQLFECHFSTISNYLTKWGIKKRSPKENKKYKQNDESFKEIKTEEDAYWLGFMYSDGYITKEKYIGISLKISDINHLVKFKNYFKVENPIHTYDGNNFGENHKYARLLFKNEDIFKNLINQGCFLQKSLILEPPKNVPMNLIKHFIRGYFDGDGSLCIGKYISFKICGTKEILSFICKMLNGKYENEFKLKLFKRYNDEKNNFYISFGGKNKTINAMKYLYEDSNVYLDRKYILYQSLITTVEPIRNDGC